MKPVSVEPELAPQADARVDTAPVTPQKKTMIADDPRTPPRPRQPWMLAVAAAAVFVIASSATSAQSCAGDCDGNGNVGVDELVREVRMALEGGGTAQCPPADTDGDHVLSIGELTAAVGKAINGCTASGAKFAEIQSTIFNTTCAVTFCHAATLPGSIPAGNLDLTEANSYDQLVGHACDNASARQAGFLRVDPGNPDNSFLVHKIEQPGSLDFGSQMPQVGGPLSAAQMKLTRDWVAEGANR